MDSLPNMDSSNNSFFSEKMRNVLGRIWAFWGLIWFVSTLLIAIIFYLPCFVLKEPTKANWHRIVSQIWMRVYLFIIGCSIKMGTATSKIKLLCFITFF